MKGMSEAAIRQISENFFLGQYSEAQMRQLLDSLRAAGETLDGNAAVALEGASAGQANCEHTLAHAVAIVGLGGFFPGSASIEEFRRHLQDQRCLIETLPTNHFCDPALAQRRGSFISDIAGFDHELFGISAREAQYMDPRLRLLLMSVWHTFEDAGVVPGDLGSAVVDVLVASEESAYGEFIVRGEMLPYTPVGASSWSLPNRLSHAFGLTGKSLFINSACAGGSVALHQALRTLRVGEADYVLVGAANLLYGEAASLTYRGQEALGILADTPTCRPFQQDAKGFLPAEAVVTVLLRRYLDAERDGDRIHGILLGSHVNHVGGQGSPAAPDAKSQAAAILGAHVDARIEPATVTYIEAHGACTLLGDVAEINAFREAERRVAAVGIDNGRERCQISSIKPNIGHANSASGLVSLIRVLHAFKIARRFGIKDFAGPSRLIDLSGSRYYLDAQAQPWERLTRQDGTAIARRAGIHNYSAGGVNAHLIVQEPKEREKVAPRESRAGAPCFVALSALHEDQLIALAQCLLDAVTTGTCGSCEQIEASSILARRALRHRAVFRFDDVESLSGKLRKYIETGGCSAYFFKSDGASRGKVASYFRANPKLARSLQELRDEADKRVLFELWCDGYEEPIRRYLLERRIVRCDLPLYPFRRQLVWLDTAAQTPRRDDSRPVLHPLVHKNVSTLEGVVFESVFSGDEDCFTEAAESRRAMVGSALLEVARAAVGLSLGDRASAQPDLAINDVGWSLPFVIDSRNERATALRIAVGADIAGEIAFEIFSRDECSAEDKVHCAGRVSFTANGTMPAVDVASLRQGCSTPANMGGITLQHAKIAEAWRAPHALLLKIDVEAAVLPQQAEASSPGAWVLHAGVIEVAAQGARALFDNGSGGIQRELPSLASVRQVRIFGAIPTRTWAWIRRNEADCSVDIDIFDEDGDGRVCLVDAHVTGVESTCEELSASVARVGAGRSAQMAGLSTAECLQWDLKALAAAVLGAPRDGLRADENFASFGFDSIGLGLLAKRLSEHFSVVFEPTVFFGHPTLARLAEYFVAEHSDVVEAFYAEGAAVPARAAPHRGVDLQKRRRLSNVGARSIQAAAGVREPVAIIGMSGRFPQADDVDAMWRVLAEGRDAVGPLGVRALDWNDRTLASQRCGLIDGVAEFDALFFEISPREAEAIDPRQRLLLQESMKALEDAGYGRGHLDRFTVGVFVGVEPGQYQGLTGKLDSVTDNSDSVLAARISYFLDLTGPNMAINTACSSGLLAAHQACMSLHQGECDTAVAAAVNLMLAPEPFVAMIRSGMLSPDGRCHAFDRRANGMVPGEAVVAVVLKRLSDAQAEGDPIYALIRASGVNYDGRTNGITAPNGVAQARLLKSLYEKYSVPVDEIEYVVTHGTGTLLGDPIEIDALCAAFKDGTQRRQYCALTSSKTNFGHTFAASGLVSLVCLVQALRHETIPPSLHCQQLSEHVDWPSTPFYVNTAPRAWPRRAGKGRLGAVSAFGVSGTNTHLVVQSYDEEARAVPDVPYSLLVLSAKQPQALQRRVEDLIAFLQGEKGAATPLSAVSHTCLVGRLHYRHRCAVVAQDRESAIAALRRWEGKEGSTTIFRGQVARDFVELESLAQHGRELIQKSGTLRSDRSAYREAVKALAQLYCQGYAFEWQALFGAQPPQRVHLPTYPFARDRHWLRGAAVQAPAALPVPSQLHPLLHVNMSDFGEQRFTSRFSGEEPLLADHVVDGRRVLPGVAYLEMARAAMEHSLQAGGHAYPVVLSRIVWLRPIVAEGPLLEVHTALQSQEDGQIVFEIYTRAADAEPVIHCQGLGRVAAPVDEQHHRLNALRDSCTERSLSVDECYERFARMGMKYGPAQRGLQALHAGVDQVLARLRLPEAVAPNADSYVLHPSLLDAALQAAIGLSRDEASARPLVPFALESAQIFGACPAEVWAWIRRSPGSTPRDLVRRLDVDLCDGLGHVCVRLQGFSARVLGDVPSSGPSGTSEVAVSSTAASSPLHHGAMLFRPQWRIAPPVRRSSTPDFAERHVLLCGWDTVFAQAIAAEVGGSCEAVIVDGGMAERFAGYAGCLFKRLRGVITTKPQGPVLVQVVVPEPAGGLRGLAGLLKTAHLENPNVWGQLLEVPHRQSVAELLAQLRSDSGAALQDEVRYA
jgi:polyketide synthase PksN